MTVADPVEQLGRRVDELCATAFTAIDAVRGVVEPVFAPWEDGEDVRRADLEVLAGAVRPIIEAADGPLIGAGFVADPGSLCDVGPAMEWWYRSPGGSARLDPVLDPAAPDFYDYVRLPWFNVPRSTGRRHVTGPYVDWLCTTEYTLTFTVPVFATHARRGREFVGVVGADVIVSWVERTLLPQIRRIDGPTALVNAEGRVVVANRTTLVTGSVTRAVDVPSLWDADSPQLRRLAEEPLAILLLDPVAP